MPKQPRSPNTVCVSVSFPNAVYQYASSTRVRGTKREGTYEIHSLSKRLATLAERGMNEELKDEQKSKRS